MQYLYRPNECQMTFQETGARQVYGIDCYRRDRKDAPPVAQYRDVSIDRGEMDRLADRCNRGQLDPPPAGRRDPGRDPVKRAQSQ